MQITKDSIAPSFSGHETFTLRSGWLKKAVDGIASDPQLFGRQDAMVTLGVGKNMVQSMKHWALSIGVLEPDPNVPNNRNRHLRVSELGELILGSGGIDPYLERTGTIWLLHFLLTSRPNGPTTWYWAFNHLGDLEFTPHRLLAELTQLIETNGWNRVAATTLERDISCFIRTYYPPQRSRTIAVEDSLDCPFIELQLLQSHDADGTYRFSRGEHPSLPHNIFAYALLCFWNRVAPKSTTLSFSEIAYQAGSPGRIFKLSESAVVDHMRQMDNVTSGAVVFDSTAGLVQVYRKREIEPIRVLRSSKPRRKK